MVGNRIFNGVLAIDVRPVRSTKDFKFAALFCKSRRENIQRKITKFLSLSCDILIRAALDAMAYGVHMISLNLFKVVENIRQRRR